MKWCIIEATAGERARFRRHKRTQACTSVVFHYKVTAKKKKKKKTTHLNWERRHLLQEARQNKINPRLSSPPAPEKPTVPSWSSSQGTSLRWVYVSLWIPLTPATSHNLLIHSTNIYWESSMCNKGAETSEVISLYSRKLHSILTKGEDIGKIRAEWGSQWVELTESYTFK